MMKSKITLFVLCLLLSIQNGTKAISWQLTATTGLVAFASGVILADYLIKRRNTKLRNHQQVLCEAQNLVRSVRAFLRPFSTIVDQMSAPTLSAEEKQSLELRLLKEVAGAFHGIMQWPFSYFENLLINDWYGKLHLQLYDLHASMVQLNQKPEEINVSLKDEFKKTESEVLTLMEDLVHVRTTFVNSSCYKLIESLPYLHL